MEIDVFSGTRRQELQRLVRSGVRRLLCHHRAAAVVGAAGLVALEWDVTSPRLIGPPALTIGQPAREFTPARCTRTAAQPPGVSAVHWSESVRASVVSTVCTKSLLWRSRTPERLGERPRDPPSVPGPARPYRLTLTQTLQLGVV